MSRLDARLAELRKAHDEAVELAGSAVSIKQVINYLAAPAGTVFLSELVVRDGTDVDLGLLIDGLEGLSRNPFVGAQQARGCGKIAFAYSVDELREGTRRPLATITGGNFSELTISPADELTGERIAKAREAVAKLVNSDIDWSLNRTLKGQKVKVGI